MQLVITASDKKHPVFLWGTFAKIYSHALFVSLFCAFCVFLLNEGVPLLNLKGKRKEPYKMQLINHIMIKGHGSIMLLGNRGELNSK